MPDENVGEVIVSCMQLGQDRQASIRNDITVDISWLLLCFGIRLAMHSLRRVSQKHFTNGLYAISLAD